MLLRASSEEIGQDVDLGATVGQAESRIPHGATLVRFTEAVIQATDDVDEARADALARLGPEAFMEAANILAIFNGLVRTADAAGIPLDDGTRNATIDDRAKLGLNEFFGSVNTDLDSAKPTDLRNPADTFRGNARR